MRITQDLAAVFTFGITFLAGTVLADIQRPILKNVLFVADRAVAGVDMAMPVVSIPSHDTVTADVGLSNSAEPTTGSQNVPRIMTQGAKCYKIVDVQAFLATIHNEPVFTRERLEFVAEQLKKAWSGRPFKSIDCHNNTYIGYSKAGNGPELLYSHLHLLADPTPFSALKTLSSQRQEYAVRDVFDSVEEMAACACFPVFVQFTEPYHDSNYDTVEGRKLLAQASAIWHQSPHRSSLLNVLDSIKSTTRITNIVCIGHGSITRGPQSLVQHIVASWLASTLTQKYAEAGKPLEKPITIIAQDPKYKTSDRVLLSGLSTPIRVVPDPQAFLDITNSSLIMYHAPWIPVKNVIADLGLSPAAILGDHYKSDEDLYGYDKVHIRLTADRGDNTYANANTRRVLEIFEGYTRMMDDEEPKKCYIGEEKVTRNAYGRKERLD